MERVRKSKTKCSLDSFFFATPEQKLLKFLLSEPTTTFTPRVLSSKLKGVRGLGGADGIVRILRQFEILGLIQFVDNNRAVCLQNDQLSVKLLKTFGAICELEGLREQLEPMSSRGVLFGSRASGHSSSDSDFNLFVVSDDGTDVTSVVSRHPLGKKIELVVRNTDDFHQIHRKDPKLHTAVDRGIVLWGASGW